MYWKDKSGKGYSMDELSNKHLINIYKMLEKLSEKDKVLIQSYEMFHFIADEIEKRNLIDTSEYRCKFTKKEITENNIIYPLRFKNFAIELAYVPLPKETICGFKKYLICEPRNIYGNYFLESDILVLYDNNENKQILLPSSKYKRAIHCLNFWIDILFDSDEFNPYLDGWK